MSVSVSLSSSSLIRLAYILLYSSSSLCSLSSCSISPLSVSSVVSSAVAEAIAGGGTRESVTSNGSSFSLSYPIGRFWKGKSFTSVTFPTSVCWAVPFLLFGSGGLKSIKDFCSFALALSPSQLSLDQSEYTGEGCGALCLQ